MSSSASPGHPASSNGASDPASAWLGDALPDVLLTKAQGRVVEVIVRNPQLSSYADIAEIAQRADVNNSTVVRAAQHLGYRGWPDLQRELRARYLVMISTEDTLVEHGAHRSPLHDALNHDIENLRLTLDANTADEAQSAIATLAEARSITVVGMGSFAGPASVMAHLGTIMGYPITLEPRGGVHLASSVNRLGPGDVLVVINMWRSMREIIAAAEAAHQAGVKVVAISDMRRGRLARSQTTAGGGLRRHLLLPVGHRRQLGGLRAADRNGGCPPRTQPRNHPPDPAALERPGIFLD